MMMSPNDMIHMFVNCSTLTSCTQCILSLLYPFEWPHVYIPVLPTTMIEALSGPGPYIIGILNSTYAQLLTTSTFQFTEVSLLC